MTLNNKVYNDIQHSIPVHTILMDIEPDIQAYEESILQGEIAGLEIIHKAFKGGRKYDLTFKDDHVTFLLILKGQGLLTIEQEIQGLEEASIVLPPTGANHANIMVDAGQTIHFLELTKKYSAEDISFLNTQKDTSRKLLYTRFQDCPPYVEKIKSPNTVSRTVLPGGIIPRVALGTVEAKGPDQVGQHSHPMLEQLFLGLADNTISVFADDAMVEMKPFSIVHIPLGSTHWVEVAERCKMHYMWMDFFLTKDGEAWLETHKPIDDNNSD